MRCGQLTLSGTTGMTATYPLTARLMRAWGPWPWHSTWWASCPSTLWLQMALWHHSSGSQQALGSPRMTTWGSWPMSEDHRWGGTSQMATLCCSRMVHQPTHRRRLMCSWGHTWTSGPRTCGHLIRQTQTHWTLHFGHTLRPRPVTSGTQMWKPSRLSSTSNGRLWTWTTSKSHMRPSGGACRALWMPTAAILSDLTHVYVSYFYY